MNSNRPRRFADTYLRDHHLPLDHGGSHQRYDLVVTGTDIIVQDNIRPTPLVLIQEGMTDPENLWFHVAKMGARVGVPRWIAKTSTTGLSDAYAIFCVASEGYRDHFIRKGVDPKKLIVTGIPNYDNAALHLSSPSPRSGYVLLATSDIRENFGWDNRRRLLERTREMAAGRPVIVKLHPNEDPKRRGAEVHQIMPGATVLSVGNPHELIAHCDCLVTQYSTLAYTGIALGKEVHSYFDVEELRRLAPLQNGGRSSQNIARECRKLVERTAEFSLDRLPEFA